MIKFNSIEQWKVYCFNTHKSYVKNKYFVSWLKEKRIDIFNCSTLQEKEVGYITQAIKNAVKIIDNNFEINLSKCNEDKLNFAISKGKLVGSKLLSTVKKSRRINKISKACIFLINKRVKSGQELLKFGDALTYVSDGVTIFTLNPSIKYPLSFYKNEVKHEMCHLLGLNIHHEDTEVEEYGKASKCLMEYNAPSEKICQKCKDGLNSFWKGVEYATRN